MKHCGRRALLFLVIALPASAFAQFTENLEVSGGYTHLTGNFGLDGFHAGAGYFYTRRVSLVAETNFLWDTSRIGVFDLTPNLGTTSIKSNEQNYLFGGRFRIIGWKPLKTLEKRKVIPFGEALFGWSRLHQKLSDTQGVISVDASDTAFTWVLGGGVDYTLSAKWLARGNLDFVRTHFVDAGQSRLKINIGLAYVF